MKKYSKKFKKTKLYDEGGDIPVRNTYNISKPEEIDYNKLAEQSTGKFGLGVGTYDIGTNSGNIYGKEYQTDFGTFGKDFLKGAATGAQIGGGFGAVIGGFGNAIGRDILGRKNQKKNTEAAQADFEAAKKAAQDEYNKKLEEYNKWQQTFGVQQQDMYTNTYNNTKQGLINSTGFVFADGGDIHIKPSHRGRFTEYLKRTGKTLEEALHSDNSHVRQMANFARNAKKWKHGDGGELGMGEDYFGLHKEQPIEPEEGEQIASDMQMVEGKRHEDGGTELKETKTKMPVGEAEKGEVIKGTEIYSDRLGIKGKTYAEFAEKLGKLKAKYEKAYLSASNFREKNSSQRNLQNVERQLKSVYNHQEMSKQLGQERNIKVGYNENQEQYADGGNPMDIVASVAPFIDNAYNAYAINQLQNTPIPLPVKRTYTPLSYGTLSAMPMKTTYNVDNNIAQNQIALKNVQKNLNENSASSQVARANELAALGKMLQGQNSIYQNKENIETQLVNNANLNNQQVFNQNVLNKQQIDNQNAGLATQMQNINAGLTDQYNQDKYLKDYAISRDKSQNVADLSYGLGNVSGSYNNRISDENKIWLDIQRDKKGSAIDNYIGTDSFDRMMANKQKRQKARELIVDPQVLKQFNEYYGED